MKLPKLYEIKSVRQKHRIIKDIVDTIERLDIKNYPNLLNQIETDTSKVNLIDMVIINMYSKDSGTKSIENALQSIEVTLN